jgi:hypothetical protein
MRTLACLMLLLAAPAVHAQMYKCTEGGRTRYSDKPITDCKNTQVKAQTNTAVAPPAAAPARRAQVTKAQAEFDHRCAQMRRDHAQLRRSPDSATRDQRLEELSKASAGCN